MKKITEHGFNRIKELPSVRVEEYPNHFEVREIDTNKIIADVWKTPKDDVMDYELFTYDKRILEAASP